MSSLHSKLAAKGLYITHLVKTKTDREPTELDRHIKNADLEIKIVRGGHKATVELS